MNENIVTQKVLTLCSHKKITRRHHVHVLTTHNRILESVTMCSYNYLIGVCYVDPGLFKPKDSLLNPKGPLLLSIPLQVIALANRKVTKATTDKSEKSDPCNTNNQLFPNCCCPFFLINKVALNTAGSFELFHDEFVHI